MIWKALNKTATQTSRHLMSYVVNTGTTYIVPFLFGHLVNFNVWTVH